MVGQGNNTQENSWQEVAESFVTRDRARAEAPSCQLLTCEGKVLRYNCRREE